MGISTTIAAPPTEKHHLNLFEINFISMKMKKTAIMSSVFSYHDKINFQIDFSIQCNAIHSLI